MNKRHLLTLLLGLALAVWPATSPAREAPSVEPGSRRAAVEAEYTNRQELAREVRHGDLRPTALVAGDLDGDGVQDLVCGYAGVDGGVVTLHRGNVESIWPGDGDEPPFLTDASVIDVPDRPDFLAAGDFDRDGSLDVVVASAGSDRLLFLRGDGSGTLVALGGVELPGIVTTMVAGEIDREDGLQDLVVAVRGAEGPRLLLLAGVRHALLDEPESLKIPRPAEALALGHLDGDAWVDLVVAAGHELLVFEGRGFAPDRPAPSRVVLPWTVGSIATADLGRGSGSRKEIVLLAEGGSLGIVREGELVVTETAGAAGRPATTGRRLLSATRLSGDPTEDLVVLDPSAARMRIFSGVEDAAALSSRSESELALDGAPVAMLPMRLNSDALSDLVVLEEGHAAPTILFSAAQATITVDTASDASTSGDGACSLREALTNANFNGDASGGDCVAGAGLDSIMFAIDGGGAPATIAPSSELPEIFDVVTIDGTTQGCVSPPCVDLDGSLAGNGTDGLSIASGSSVVRGMVIRGFSRNGILISSPANIVEGNYIGTDASGTVAQGNGAAGIAIQSGPSNTIGGTTASARNVLSGNGDEGISIASGISTGIRIEGNHIGTDVSGTLALGNGTDGINIGSAPNNVVGGTGAGAGNLISGNEDDGIYIVSEGAIGNRIQGNIVGMDLSGVVALPNGDDGVEIRGASENTVGGLGAATRNWVSGNGGDGVAVTFDATGNLVQGNFIGTDLSGAVAVPNVDDGVEIRSAPDNTIGGATAGLGNLISGNADRGVSIDSAGATGNRVEGNFVGTDVSGTLPLGNLSDGILIGDASNNVIGGTEAGTGNVVSSNGDDGIIISSPGSTGNQVLGNFLGTDPSGTAELGNTDDGIEIRDAADNTIGDGTPAGRNIVSGNDGDGVSLSGTATGNRVRGNFIGTALGGTLALGNGDDGIEVRTATSSIIGGVDPGDRNVVSGNDGDGIVVADGASGTRIEGNFIGTDLTGAVDLGNADDGIDLQGATGCVVGGAIAAARNIISGNDGDGVAVAAAATGNTILGNYIGLDVTGANGVGNLDDGVEIRDGSSNTFGGTAAGAGNVISGNGDNGVYLVSAATTLNQVQGNLIGLDAVGSAVVLNFGNGVEIEDALNNTIGGTLPGAGNRIEGNDGSGVEVTGLGPGGAAILGNSITSNALLGIALGTPVVLPNDAGDLDSGPNGLQNYPVVLSATAGPFATSVAGTMNSTISTTLRLEFFSNDSCDISGHGEGAVFLGSVDVTTDVAGNASFDAPLAEAAELGELVTATATNLAAGVTSEFSACVAVTEQCMPVLELDRTGSEIQINWSDLGAATLYDVTRGSLVALKASDGDYGVATEGCVANDAPKAPVVYSEVSPGESVWFLVRGADGADGTYDVRALSQMAPRDAEIAASGNDCP